ncbi:MAG: O-methyltransferase [Paludibacter sp.]|nr:O-methyltransferase [Paludibacter sp.]
MLNKDDYLEQNSEREPLYLQKISRAAHVRLLNARMISGALQGRLLKMFCQMIQPQNILEIGTFVGYSTLCLAEGAGRGTAIHTIEIDDELEDLIRENFNSAPFDTQNIVLHIGDALNIIKNNLQNIAFDLVFIDGDKRQYLQYYQAVLPLVRTGGFILADNTLWNGKIFENIKSNDFQTQEIIKFNDFIANDIRIEKVILPVRDGLTVIRKK